MSEEEREFTQSISLDDIVSVEKLEQIICDEAGDWPFEPSDFIEKMRPPEVGSETWWEMTVEEAISNLVCKDKLINLYEGIEVYAVPGRHCVNETTGDIEEIEEGSEAQPAGGDQTSPDGATQNVAQGENPGDQSE